MRISASFHHASRRDKPSSDTARETIRKISFKPTSRRSSHLRSGQDRPGACRTLDRALQGLCPGSIGFRHPQVGWAIWHTAEALIPPATSLAALEQPHMERLRMQITADPAGFFGPFGNSVAEVEASCRRFDIAAAQLAIMLAAESAPDRQRILAQGLADASANASQARTRLRWLLLLAHAWQVRNLLYRARLHALVGAAAVALGAVLFITATSASTSTATTPTPAASARTIAR
jgi:hypothetical protein